jgi:hypothetical protein
VSLWNLKLGEYETWKRWVIREFGIKKLDVRKHISTKLFMANPLKQMQQTIEAGARSSDVPESSPDLPEDLKANLRENFKSYLVSSNPGIAENVAELICNYVFDEQAIFIYDWSVDDIRQSLEAWGNLNEGIDPSREQRISVLTHFNSMVAVSMEKLDARYGDLRGKILINGETEVAEAKNVYPEIIKSLPFFIESLTPQEVSDLGGEDVLNKLKEDLARYPYPQSLYGIFVDEKKLKTCLSLVKVAFEQRFIVGGEGSDGKGIGPCCLPLDEAIENATIMGRKYRKIQTFEFGNFLIKSFGLNKLISKFMTEGLLDEICKIVVIEGKYDDSILKTLALDRLIEFDPTGRTLVVLNRLLNKDVGGSWQVDSSGESLKKINKAEFICEMLEDIGPDNFLREGFSDATLAKVGFVFDLWERVAYNLEIRTPPVRTVSNYYNLIYYNLMKLFIKFLSPEAFRPGACDVSFLEFVHQDLKRLFNGRPLFDDFKIVHQSIVSFYGILQKTVFQVYGFEIEKLKKINELDLSLRLSFLNGLTLEGFVKLTTEKLVVLIGIFRSKDAKFQEFLQSIPCVSLAESYISKEQISSFFEFYEESPEIFRAIGKEVFCSPFYFKESIPVISKLLAQEVITSSQFLDFLRKGGKDLLLLPEMNPNALEQYILMYIEDPVGFVGKSQSDSFSVGGTSSFFTRFAGQDEDPLLP